MSWLQLYWLRHFARSSLLLFPGLCGLVALLIGPLLRWLDRQTGWTVFDFSADGARALLGAFTVSLLTFIVFVLSSMLIVVQLASAQLTPRIIAHSFSSRLIKLALGIFHLLLHLHAGSPGKSRSARAPADGRRRHSQQPGLCRRLLSLRPTARHRTEADSRHAGSSDRKPDRNRKSLSPSV